MPDTVQIRDRRSAGKLRIVYCVDINNCGWRGRRMVAHGCGLAVCPKCGGHTKVNTRPRGRPRKPDASLKNLPPLEAIDFRYTLRNGVGDLSLGVITEVCAFVRKGAYPLVAARACGISDPQWAHWSRTGHADIKSGKESLYATLMQNVDRAGAEFEIEKGQEVQDLYQGRQTASWMGPMTFLERRHRDRWGRSEKVQMEVNGIVRHALLDVPPSPPRTLEAWVERSRIQMQMSERLQLQAKDAEAVELPQSQELLMVVGQEAFSNGGTLDTSVQDGEVGDGK